MKVYAVVFAKGELVSTNVRKQLNTNVLFQSSDISESHVVRAKRRI